MKTQVTIYGQTYEVEIKVKFADNSNVSPKATNQVTQWLEARLWESSHANEQFADIEKEIREVAAKLHRYNELQFTHYNK